MEPQSNPNGEIAYNGSVTDQIAELLNEDSAPAPEKKEKPKPKPEPIEVEDDDDDKGDDVDVDNDTDNDTDSDDDTDFGIDTEPDDEDNTTWGKALGVDDNAIVLDDNGDFTGVNVKIDGQTSTVGIKDLIAGYQSSRSNTNKSKALAEQRREFDGLRVEVAQDYKKKLDDVSALTQYLESSLMKDYRAIDWNNLRATDPAEYAASVQDYNLKVSEIAQIKQAIGSVKNDEMSVQVAQWQQGRQEFLKDQVEKAIERNPAWANPTTFKKDLSDMSDFLNESYGFTAAEFGEIADHRMLQVIADAKKYRAGKQVAEKKIAQPLAKYQKPTGTNKRTISKLDRLTKIAKSSSGHARRGAETDAVMELLGGV